MKQGVILRRLLEERHIIRHARCAATPSTPYRDISACSTASPDHLDDCSTPAACTWTIQAPITFHVQSNWGQFASLIGRKNYWIIDLGRIESLALTLKDAADCQKAFALRGAPLLARFEEFRASKSGPCGRKADLEGLQGRMPCSAQSGKVHALAISAATGMARCPQATVQRGITTVIDVSIPGFPTRRSAPSRR
jgi:hypothetical protein